MHTVKKAVIPAAGMGTRFLPATKAVPKELLPIVDMPTLQLIIDEAQASGIEDILLVVSEYKDAIRHHFAKDVHLEEFLEAHNKAALLERVRTINPNVSISYILQKEPLGLGHAVSLAQEFAKGEAIAVLLGDDIVDAETPALAQLLSVYEKTGASVVGVQAVAPENIHKYGIVAPKGDLTNGQCAVQSLVEKPSLEEAPSNLAIMGRYVVTPAIFDILAQTKPGKGGEIQLTDALNTLATQENMTALDFSGTRFDVGDQLGFVKANINYALKREELHDGLAHYIKELAERL